MFITNKTFWTKTEVVTLKHRLYIEDVQRPIVTPQVHVFKTLFWYFDSRSSEAALTVKPRPPQARTAFGSIKNRLNDT